MSDQQDIEFGFVAASSGERSLTDGQTYDEIVVL